MTNEKMHIRSIVAALALALIPHIGTLPKWIVGWCLALWGLAYFLEAKGLPQPPKLLRVALTLLGAAGVVGTYGQYSVDACVSLVAVLLGVKPLETGTGRDKQALIFISYFLVLTAFFYSQSLLMTLYLVTAVLLTTSALIVVNDLTTTLKQAVKKTGWMIVQASPLVLVAFLAFPRISTNLWGFALNPQAVSGITDSFAPGDINRLVQDGSVAFRATFEDALPAAQDRYWRGLVFYNFDGKTWRHSKRHVGVRAKPLKSKKAITYQISLEPHSQNWLFALDTPDRSSLTTGFVLKDNSFISLKPITERTDYTVTSLLRADTSAQEVFPDLTLALPKDGNLKARARAKSWLDESKGDSQSYIDLILTYIAEQNFYYTLAPPLLGDDSIDDFLFNTRKGYCEHYASAFAFLMRAAGIPTRIIGGYLGGEVNPLGNYMIIRQSDAHVWVEVWLKGKGWIRVDPTSAVAPDRIVNGIEASVNPDELPLFLSSSKLGPLYQHWRSATLHWDLINFRWDSWMTGYTRLSQMELLKKLGIDPRSAKGGTLLALLILTVLGMTVSVAFYIANRATPRNLDPIRKTYDLFLKKLAKAGVDKPASMGPVEFNQLVVERLPTAAENTTEITELYVELRYKESEIREELVKKLEDRVNHLALHVEH